MRMLLMLLALLVSAGLVACGSDSPTDPAPADPNEFRAVLATGGTYEVVTPSESSEVLDEQDEFDPADENVWRCTTERRSVVDAPEDYATFNPNAEVIYPGSLVQGSSLAGATPEPIVVERAAGTISIDIVNGSQGVSQPVDQVKRSTISQATNDIIEANSGVVPAAFTFNFSEVQSSQEMALKMGVNYSTLTTKVRSDLSFSSSSDYRRVLVSFNQRFYTMSYDLPTSMAQVFAPSVTPEDLDPYVGPGNPACYISSVTYGRRYYLLIESTSTLEEMRASIQGSYEAAVSSGGGSFSGKYVTELSEVNIKIFALGGNADSAIAAFNGDLSQLRGYLQDSDIRTGVPLSYVVRNVVDNRTVNVKVATDYDLKTCEVVGAGVMNDSFSTPGVAGWSGSGDYYDLKWGDLAQFRYQGGYIWAKDEGSGGTWFFRVADRYHGDLSHMVGGTMSFALNAGAGSNGDPRVNGTYVDQGDAILISGGTMTLAYRLSPAQWPVAEVYRYYEIGMGEGDGWSVVENPDYYAPESARPAATEAQIREVLRNVTSIRIRGEWFRGLDWCSIDEFRMVSPVVPPARALASAADLPWGVEVFRN